MDDAREPKPQESGQLSPPARRPPTAVGAGTPERPRNPQSRGAGLRPSRWHELAFLLLLLGASVIPLLFLRRDPFVALIALGGALISAPAFYRHRLEVAVRRYVVALGLSTTFGGIGAVGRLLLSPGKIYGPEGYLFPFISGMGIGFVVGLTFCYVALMLSMLYVLRSIRLRAASASKQSPGA